MPPLTPVNALTTYMLSHFSRLNRFSSVLTFEYNNESCFQGIRHMKIETEQGPQFYKEDTIMALLGRGLTVLHYRMPSVWIKNLVMFKL